MSAFITANWIEQMAALNDVFGVHNPAPMLTYVDRAGLDQRIKYFLNTGRHLVIHGPSKQGKSALRKRAIPDEQCLVIQCRRRPMTDEIYAEVLEACGTTVEVSRTSLSSKEISAGGQAKAGGTFLKIISGEATASGGGKLAWQNGTTEQAVGTGINNIKIVATAIRKTGKRLILEDFHYIPETEKKNIAHDLKAFYELHVPLLLVGAWEQDQLLPKYNGDLTGRIDEINVRWTDDELREVIERGESALNVRFSREISKTIISDASGNVGLLQRLLERYCFAANVLFSHQGTQKRFASDKPLQEARKHICKEEAARYQAFGWSVCEGFPNSNDVTKRLYMHIIQVCVEATDAELLAGLPLDLIESRIAQNAPTIPTKSVRTGLQQIDKLQSDKAIYPVIATYDPVNRVLSLADREMLFYRKYGGPRWPWEDIDEQG